MAKNYSSKEKNQEQEKEKEPEMTLEEAKALRASKHKPKNRVLSEGEKREEFRVFWAKERRTYGETKNLEEILWVHLKASKLSDPEQFENGLKHFGLKKVK